jgi:Domain of unknown function (DUF4832)/Domain of unknown function (DUF4874)
MFKYTSIFSVILLFTLLCFTFIFNNFEETKTAHASVVNYTENTANIPNPERGFNLQTNGDVSLNELNNIKNSDSITMKKQVYYIRDFINSPFTPEYIDYLRSEAAIFRQAGAKVWLNFQYANNDIDLPSDATVTIIKTQIEQLKPYMEDNKDVIVGMSSSWVGPWGEFGRSDNDNISNDNTGGGGTITNNTRIIYEAILSNLPKERSFLARYPGIKKQFFGTTPLTSGEAFNQTDKARIGHQDDSFAANDLDGATFANGFGQPGRQEEEDYLSEDSKYTPNIGETEYFDNGVTGQCPNAIRLLKLSRMSSLNISYNVNTLNIWRNQGCFDEIAKNLGYRFVLANSQTPAAVNTGGNLNLKLTLENKGYASPFNGRNLEIVMRDKASGQEYKYDVTSQSDPRRWLPDLGQFTVDLNTTVNAPAGDYDIFVNLPDPMQSIKNRPEYSIQLANVGTWEASTGYNRLNQSVTVQAAIVPSSSSSSISTSSSLAQTFSSSLSSLPASTSSSSISSSTIPPISTTLNLKVFLSGAFDKSLKQMTNNLHLQSLIPTVQPFAARYNYFGNESLNSINLATNICDWVLVEIRDPSSNVIVAQKAAVIRTDGRLVEANNYNNGNTQYGLTFQNLIGQYKVIIRHRNHLAIATNSPITFGQNNTENIDFSTNVNVKNSNQSLLGVGSNGLNIYGLRQSNASSDQFIDATDKTILLNARESINLYRYEDINLDGFVDATDRTIAFNNPDAVESL